MSPSEAAFAAPVKAPQAVGRARWRLPPVLMVTLLVGYYDRLNVSLAMPLIAAEQGWSPQQTEHYGGLLMSLFYVGYGLANIFLSPLAARIGPRKSLIFIIALWSLFTSLGAWVSQSLMLFIAARVLLGLAEGVHVPMMNLLTKHWFPLAERSRANGLWIAGLFLAVLTAPLWMVPLMDAHGWRAGFHWLALLGALVSLPLVLWQVRDHPAQHPAVGAAEREWLAAELAREDQQVARELGAGLWTLLRTPAFVLMLTAGIFNNVIALGLAGWLPTYLSAREGVSYADLSYLAAIPYVFTLAGLVVWSLLGDAGNARARNAAIGYLLTGGFIYLALIQSGLWATLALFGAACFCVASYNACEFAMVQRILPAERLATGAGIYNGLSTMIGGALGPLVVGGIIGGGTSMVALLPILGFCIAQAITLYALGRISRY